jgi:hypothetical protein
MGQAVLFSNERYHGVKFGLLSGTLTVSSASPEMGEASETIDVEFSGDEFSIASMLHMCSRCWELSRRGLKGLGGFESPSLRH